MGAVLKKQLRVVGLLGNDDLGSNNFLAIFNYFLKDFLLFLKLARKAMK